MISDRITRRVLFVFLLLSGISIPFTATGQSRYYWVGKGDRTSWNDIMNWSATSGGLGGSAGGITDVPKPDNTVVFNENSTLINTRNVSISTTAQCDSLIVENCTAATLPSFYMGGSLTISGSLFLQPGSQCYTTKFNFASTRPLETIETNGVNLSGQMTNSVTFNGSAEYRLSGNTAFGDIIINNGVLNLNGNNISCYEITVPSGAAYSGEIWFSGSVIDCDVNWSHSRTLTSAHSDNSLIRVGTGDFIGTATQVYHNLEIYNGRGASSSSRRISGNAIFNKITLLRGRTVIHGLITDSLVVSTLSSTNIAAAVRINDYLEVKPPVCGGQARFFGNGNTTNANRTITMGAGAHVVIERAVIHDLIITGATANAEKSYDWGRNQGFNFNTISTPDVGRDLYWTGGGGSLNDPAHWSLTADGLTPAHCVPALADNVFFGFAANAGGTAISSTNPVFVNMDFWCNNMVWDGVPGTPYLRESYSYYLLGYRPSTGDIMIGGSLTLQNSLRIIVHNTTSSTYNASRLYFVSNRSNETITTNGCHTGFDTYFQSVDGTGKWTLTDDLTLSGFNDGSGYEEDRWRYIFFNRGHLDLNGKNLSVRAFNADPNDTISGFSGRLSSRTLNMANSEIHAIYYWQYEGGGQLTALQSEGSSIIVGHTTTVPIVYVKTDDHYHNVQMVGGGTSSIRNISRGSTGNTFFNKIDLACVAVYYNNSDIAFGNILPDSLLFTGFGTYTFAKNSMVNKYFGSTTACGGLSTITATAARTITIGTVLPHADRVKIRNTNIHNLSISPADTLYAVLDCNFSGTSNGWINTSSLPQTFYWVGGTGNWSDNKNWSLTSGLHGGSMGDSTGCVPGPSDNVIFDNGSFSAPNQTVTVDKNGYCDSMIWIGSESLSPEFIVAQDVNLYINGSLEFQKGMRANTVRGQVGYIHFTSSRPNETIKSNGVNFYHTRVYFNGTGGWKFLDDYFAAPPAGTFSGNSVTFYQGSLNFNGQNVTIHGFSVAGARDNRYLDMRNSTIYMASSNDGFWNYTGNLQAENSELILRSRNNFIGEQDALYHNLTFSYIYGSVSCSWGKFNKITVLGGNLTFGNSSTSYIETDTLILNNSSSHIYKFYSGSRLTVHEAFYGNGTPCFPIYLQSTSETISAIFDIKLAAANYDGIRGTGTKDTLMIDYAYIHGIRALTNPDNAFLYKGMHCPDVDRSGAAAWGYGVGTDSYNQNWARMDAYGSGGTSAFGDLERILACEEFPYLLGSENFSPTPVTRFKWFKCGYAELDAKFNAAPGATPVEKFDNLTGYVSTAADILITGRGTFSLIVDYGNGCVSWDDIKITTLTCCAPVPLPVTSPQTFCAGSTVSDLQAEGEEDGIIHWYRLTAGDTVRLDGNTLLEDGATYYATQQVDSCESVISDTIKALVALIPKPALELTGTGSANPSVSIGTAITDIVYAYGGSAVGATVSFTPSTGHGFTYSVDSVLQTVTVSGAAATVQTVTYTVTALADTYCPDSVFTGTITVNNPAIVGTVFPFVHTGDTSFDRHFTVTASLYADPVETVGARKLTALLRSKPLLVDTLKYYDSTVYIPGTPKNPGGFMQTNNPGLPLDWSRLGQTAGLPDTATVQFMGDLPGKPIGYYSFTVPSGEYILVLSRAGYLDRYVEIVVGADSYLGHRELISGDLDGSGNVTVADLSRIKSGQSALFGDGLYKAEHDLDGNRSIGQPELDMVLFYMGATYLIYPETRIWLYGK